MQLFGYYVEIPFIIIGAAIILLLVALIIAAIIKREKNTEVTDPDDREEFGNFSGLLTREDFEVRCDDPMLEVYRMQWIKAEPGDQKDNYLLLYLALKQLNKEQDESEEEWTQEQCEERMDQIIAELSEKTGIKLIELDSCDPEVEEYFEEMEDEEYSEDDAEDSDDEDDEIK